MIGGRVVDLWIWDPDYVAVVVQDVKDCSEVNIEKNSHSLTLSRGDTLWWQAGYAYWTSKDKSMADVPIKKYGYSTRAEACISADRLARRNQ